MEVIGLKAGKKATYEEELVVYQVGLTRPPREFERTCSSRNGFNLALAVGTFSFLFFVET